LTTSPPTTFQWRRAGLFDEDSDEEGDMRHCEVTVISNQPGEDLMKKGLAARKAQSVRFTVVA
jgi:hypothetical protein